MMFLGHQLVGDLVEVGDDDVEAGLERAVVLAQALDDPFLALRHDAHALGDGDGDKGQEGDDDDKSGTDFHVQLPVGFADGSGSCLRLQ